MKVRLTIKLTPEEMLHLAWVLTPYFRDEQIQRIASRFDCFIRRDDNGKWTDDIPF